MVERSGPVVVTGASSGIGRSIAERLSELGVTVFATARREPDLESLSKLSGVTPVRLDVTREDEIRQVLPVVESRGKGLYGLVNNAGIADLTPTIDTSTEELAQVLNVNLYGVHRMVRACFPLLRESRGRIVNISSINGVAAEKFAAAYSASKFALEAYSEVLREELSGLGIGVSVVEPGGFHSEIMSKSMARRTTGLEAAYADSPNRDDFLKMMSEFIGTPEALNRTKYPDPRPVAEAVVSALLSPSPKPRYLVGNTEEMDWTISSVLRLLVQLSGPEGRGLTRDELLDRVRAAMP